MRKSLSFLLVVLMLASLFTIGASAASYRPALVITKISPDQNFVEGRTWPTTEGTTNGMDIFEALEIVNTSGKPLNLYEYGIFYSGSATTSANYGKMWEVTPFKTGDFRDGSTSTYANMPVNPDEFVMDVGEVVVVWCIYADAIKSNASMEEFRAFWNIPDNVRSIAWDGNGDTKQGGNDKNFNLKNSATGTYGIYKISSQIVEEISLFGDGESYSQVSYGSSPIPEKTVANTAVVYAFDGKRQMKAIDYDENPQFGVLTEEQITAFGDLLSEQTVDEAALRAEKARRLAMIMYSIFG